MHAHDTSPQDQRRWAGTRGHRRSPSVIVFRHAADGQGTRLQPDDIGALQRTAGNRAVAAMLTAVQRHPPSPGQSSRPPKPPPPGIDPSFDFLGREFQSFGGPNQRGPGAILATRLTTAEVHLQEQFDALPPEQKVDAQGRPFATLADWLGIRFQHIGWRPNAGPHTGGFAIDVDAETNPYIATRTGDRFGGEAPRSKRDAQGNVIKDPTTGRPVPELCKDQLDRIRSEAIAANDRAMSWVYGAGTKADLSQRKRLTGRRESGAEAYERFATASNALSWYLSMACPYRTAGDDIAREPVTDAATASRDDLLQRIPEGKERRSVADGIATILWWAMFRFQTPIDPGLAEEWYFQILRDYEVVRIPMQHGPPSEAPQTTRNPTAGFLNMRRELVVALTDVAGLDWGLIDFGGESGDTMHFDVPKAERTADTTP